MVVPPAQPSAVARALGSLARSRLAQYALVLWVALTLNFALPRLAPGDPLEFLFGQELSTLTPTERTRVLHELGQDRPLLQQYAQYLGGIARGDLGRSIRFGRPVSEILADRLVWTSMLVLPALVLSALIGTALGLAAAWRRGRAADAWLLTVMLVLDSLPVFWIGMLLLAVFAGTLGWLPSFGSLAFVGGDSTLATAAHAVRLLLLPVATLTLAGVGHTFLLARAALLTTLDEEYVRFAEAKGVHPRDVLLRHALRNSILPVYTHVSLGLTGLVSGAVVVETVFAYPGLGRVIVDAVSARDYPLLQGAFVLLVFSVLVVNWLTDLTYGLIDPRVRRASGAD